MERERLLRLRDVEAQVGLRKTAIYELIKQRTFPEPTIEEKRQ